MAIEIGSKAPLFVLYNTYKQEVKLEDHIGENIVLLFFPLAFTSVCTEELCHMRDNLSRYEALNTKIFGISVDTLFSLGKFKEENELNFHLLSDFNRDASKAYGALYEEFIFDMKGVSKRAVFVIGADGKVKYKEILENAGDLPQFTPILDCLSKLN